MELKIPSRLEVVVTLEDGEIWISQPGDQHNETVVLCADNARRVAKALNQMAKILKEKEAK